MTARSTFSPVRKRDVRALIAAVPQSDMSQWESLSSTYEEAVAVKAALPEGSEISCNLVHDDLVGDKGGTTASDLIELLPQSTILHLACHGHQDPDNALRSGFVMKDELLTIERLMPTIHQPLMQQRPLMQHRHKSLSCSFPAHSFVLRKNPCNLKHLHLMCASAEVCKRSGSGYRKTIVLLEQADATRRGYSTASLRWIGNAYFLKIFGATLDALLYPQSQPDL